MCVRRRVRAGGLAVALAVATWAPAASAVCWLTGVTPMRFDNYTPFGAGVSATSTITYFCFGAQPSWVGISAPRVMAAGGNSMQFEVYQEASHTNVWPSAPPVPVPVPPFIGVRSVTVYGFLPPQESAAGDYQTTLTVSMFSGTTANLTGTANLNVSTFNYVDTCIINAGTLAFGSYDPLNAHAAAPRDAQGTIDIACSRDAAYTVSLGLGSYPSGTTRQMANATSRLAYELYSDAGRTTVWSTTSPVAGVAPNIQPIPLVVHGRIPPAQVVAPGPYQDVVTSTINF